MRKGVVLKIKKDRATIMADDCTFCEIRSFKGMYPGMELCFNEGDILKKKIKLRRNKYVTAACFMLIVLSSYLFLNFYQENIAAYAYVGIDINPSIEIALNKKGKIINARGLDEEGKEILQEIDIKKMESVEGVKAIISKSIEMNYIEEDNTNEITVYAVTDEKNTEAGNELVQKVEKVIKEEVDAHSLKGEIKTFVSSKKVKNEADKKGISVARYIAEDAKETVAREIDKKDNKNSKENKALEDSKDNNWKKDKDEMGDNKDRYDNKYDKDEKSVNRDARDKEDKKDNRDNNKESNAKDKKDKREEKDKNDDKKDKDNDDKEDERKNDQSKNNKDDEDNEKDKSRNNRQEKDDKNGNEDKSDSKNNWRYKNKN